MKKKVIAAISMLALLLSGCGSSSMSSEEASASYYDNGAYYDVSVGEAASADYGYYEDSADYDEEYYADGYSDFSSDTSETDLTDVYSRTDVKLIRRATLTLETLDFDASCDGLEELVTALGGYMESAEVYEGGYYDSYRSADYVARVPSEKYQEFLDSVADGETSFLRNKSESTEDIGQEYADTENHIAMLNTKLERLNTLLAEAENMEDIITLEDSISYTEYELNAYTSQLNSYNSLISYATFTVSVCEVEEPTPTVELTFWQRLGNSFTDGCEAFVYGVQNFLYWLVGNIFTLLVFAAVVFGIICLIRRSRRKADERSADGDKPRGRKKHRFGRKKEKQAAESEQKNPLDTEETEK